MCAECLCQQNECQLGWGDISHFADWEVTKWQEYSSNWYDGAVTTSDALLLLLQTSECKLIEEKSIDWVEYGHHN